MDLEQSGKEQWYMQEQSRLRRIGDKESLKKLVKQYEIEMGTIYGTFSYSQEDVERAKKEKKV